MLRTVADETPRPAAATSSDDATGSPELMYSRTSASSTRFDRSCGSMLIGNSVGSLGLRLLKHYSRSKSGPVRETPCFSSRRHAQLIEVETLGPELIDEDCPVDDRRADIGSAGGIHERGVRIACGHERQSVGIDDNEIGTFARLDRPNLTVQAEGTSSVPGRHGQRIARGQRARF